MSDGIPGGDMDEETALTSRVGVDPLVMHTPSHPCRRPDEASEDVGYGQAIDVCWEEEGELWASNGEYSTQVNFCPFCGYKAVKQIGA